MTTTYTISAGYLDSTLDACHARTGHASVDDALDALAQVGGGPEIATGADFAAVEADDGLSTATYVYVSQADADADTDGSGAYAVIREERGEEEDDEDQD